MAGLSDYLPASMRYNNPGAMNYGPFASRRGATRAGRFAQFATPEAGWAAMDDLLGSYRQRGLNTPASVIGRWAPRGVDNNSTDAYISRVSSGLGIGPNDTIPDAMWPQLAEAMAGYEAGRPNPRPGGALPSLPSWPPIMGAGLGGLPAPEETVSGPPPNKGSVQQLDAPTPPLGPPLLSMGRKDLPSLEQVARLFAMPPLPPSLPGRHGIGSDFVASPPDAAPSGAVSAPSVSPMRPDELAGEASTAAGNPLLTPASLPTSSVSPAPAPTPRPFSLNDLASNPLFMAGLSILGTAPGGNWGPAGAQAMAAATKGEREAEEFQRLQRQRATMDRIWSEAFPGGQPNMQHPLLTGQTPQVAAMIAGLGPEAAIPMLAKSAMDRHPLEFKVAGDQAFVFDPRTGQATSVPGSLPKAPSGFRWAEGGQLEPIPGGPGEHIAGEQAGRIAMMRTAREQMPSVRQFFTRHWGAGETARNIIGGSIIAPEYDRQRRVVETAIEGALRSMTGAAAPPAEIAHYMNLFMPKVTDPPATARQKLDLLERFMTNAEDLVTRGRRPAGSAPVSTSRVRTYNPATGELE